jgi:CheY-like chemotaxis protein
VAASTVNSAEDALKELAARDYDLVLTDAQMPEVDGFMLAEQIKQHDQLRSTVVMMLTSGDRPGDLARCEQLGIAAYLLKPIKHSELLEAIELGRGAVEVEVGPPERVPQIRYRDHVLVRVEQHARARGRRGRDAEERVVRGAERIHRGPRGADAHL